MIEDWTAFGTEIYFLFYEEIIKNPLPEIEKLLKHFKIPFSSLRMQCLNNSLEGAFHRNNHMQVDPFTSDQRRLVDIAIMEGDRIIRRKTGKGIPLHLYK